MYLNKKDLLEIESELRFWLVICGQGTRSTSKAPHQSAYRKHMGLMSFVYSNFFYCYRRSYLHQQHVHQEPNSLLDADLR